MKIFAALTLAAAALATPGYAGGNFTYEFPTLTWPETPSQPDVPTRLCAPGITITEDTASDCAPAD